MRSSIHLPKYAGNGITNTGLKCDSCQEYRWLHSQHPDQMDKGMLLVFLAQCPHTEICKITFARIFLHSQKYLWYFNAFGNYLSTYQ